MPKFGESEADGARWNTQEQPVTADQTVSLDDWIEAEIPKTAEEKTEEKSDEQASEELTQEEISEWIDVKMEDAL